MDREYRQSRPAEFFAENFHLLGFRNPAHALVTSVKEAVDNTLDTCEDAGVLPNIRLELDDIESDSDYDKIRMCVEDNGTGIPHDEIENVFGKFLYGSRFGRWVQSRGQQGIGVSAIFLWSQIRGSTPMTIRSRVEGEDAYEVVMRAKKKGKEREILSEGAIDWDKDHGTRIEVEINASWQSKRYLYEYLEGTSLANPWARIEYVKNGRTHTVFERSTDELPDPPQEIGPHPHSATKGQIDQLREHTSGRKVKTFLEREYHRLNSTNSDKSVLVCERADIDYHKSPDELTQEEMESLASELRKLDIFRPSDRCLSPLGNELIRNTLNTYNPEFIGTEKREMMTYEGHPVIVEAGIAYGGEINSSGDVDYYRVANRVPLVYNGGSCALQKGVQDVDWSRYELDQSATGGPMGPAVMMVHLCSTDIPFANEAKTYVDDIGEIRDEVRKALQACGRQFSEFVRKRRKQREHKEKMEDLGRIYPEMARKLASTTGREEPDIYESLAKAGSTIIIDDRDDTENVIINPNGKRKSVKVNGDTIRIDPGETAPFEDIDEIAFDRHPIHVTDVQIV